MKNVACWGCDHWRRVGDATTCMACHYALDTGRCRIPICPPGEACTVREEKGVRVPWSPTHKRQIPPKAYRAAAFEEFYNHGLNDVQIAEAVGCHQWTVASWWQRMYQGFCQVKMEGFSDEFYGTWPTWGVMRSGTVFQPMLPVQNFGESESQLWPRPIASDSIAWTKCRASNPRISIVKSWSRHGQDRPIYDFMWNGLSATQAAEYHEMMMGFPPHWTDLNASETP